jgi:hypothetical protein
MLCRSKVQPLEPVSLKGIFFKGDKLWLQLAGTYVNLSLPSVHQVTIRCVPQIEYHIPFGWACQTAIVLLDTAYFKESLTVGVLANNRDHSENDWYSEHGGSLAHTVS